MKLIEFTPDTNKQLSEITEIEAFFKQSTVKKALNLIPEYVAFLKKKNNKPATINKKLVMLNGYFKNAVIKKAIDSIPQLPFQKVKNGKTEFLSRSEVILLNRYFKQQGLDYMRLIILIGVYTGMRIQNILNLKPSDIDNGYIRIWENKTNHPYSIPIKKRLRKLMENFKGFNQKYSNVYYLFKKGVHSIGLNKNISPHVLRHTFCSWLAIKGVNAITIQVLANHKNVNTTMRYTHLNNKAMESAIERI